MPHGEVSGYNNLATTKYYTKAALIQLLSTDMYTATTGLASAHVYNTAKQYNTF